VLVLVVSSAHRGQPLPPGFAMVSGLSRRGSRTSRELATHARGRSRKEIEEVVGVQLAPGGGPAVWLQKPSVAIHTYTQHPCVAGGRNTPYRKSSHQKTVQVTQITRAFKFSTTVFS
jgi:hypothetical protein